MVKPSPQDFDVMIIAPFGAVGVKTQSDYVVGIQLFPTRQKTREVMSAYAQNVSHQIAQYFMQADTRFDILYATSGTPFQKRVWEAISAIPVGGVLTYTELAEKVGSGPRAVANACGANQLPLIIPCHRVVAKNGLGGFMQRVEGGLTIKKWLLAHESN